MSNVAIVPARKGSKGIPNKNMSLLDGRPLIEYTIEAAVESQNIDYVLVTSDSEEILALSKKFGNKIIQIKRPAELSTDKSTTASVVEHAVKIYHNLIGKPDFIILLQPTSPLRRVTFIEECISLIKMTNKNSLVSVSDPIQHPYDFLTHKNGIIEYMCREGENNQRQDFKLAKFMNGSIYITKYEYFLLTNKIYSLDSCVLYEIPIEFSIDIDTHLDLLFCETIMKLSKEVNSNGKI